MVMFSYCNMEHIEGLDTVRYDRSSLSILDLNNIMMQVSFAAFSLSSLCYLLRIFG